MPHAPSAPPGPGLNSKDKQGIQEMGETAYLWLQKDWQTGKGRGRVRGTERQTSGQSCADGCRSGCCGIGWRDGCV